jgi:multidrug efflux pump subunit AcrA (membrane-fusion protein)
VSDTTFTLADAGTYQVLFQVSVTEAGQLVLALDGNELASSVVGRATGTSQIVGMSIIETAADGAVLSVRNPASAAAALTVTSSAGGSDPVSAHLVIVRLA